MAKIIIKESQLKYILAEMKRTTTDWYKTGSDWDWSDEDDKAVEKMKKDGAEIRKKLRKQKHDKFIELIKGVKKD